MPSREALQSPFLHADRLSRVRKNNCRRACAANLRVGGRLTESDMSSHTGARQRWKVIACATVAEELKPMLPPHVECEVLEFGLHLTPARLRDVLQARIDASAGVSTILLGYGLCSGGAAGLRADHARLVIPRMDDCIGIFLGSKAEYRRQFIGVPGTYYLTKGWVECGDTPLTEYEKMAEKYGEEMALWMSREVLKHYTRIALIDTGQYELGRYRAHARRVAELYDLRFEEIPGSLSLLRKLLTGLWDDEFVVVEPGQETTQAMFLPSLR